MGLVLSDNKPSVNLPSSPSSVFQILNADGYRRGRWYTSRADAESACPRGGQVIETDAWEMLASSPIPWRVVDEVLGIERVYMRALKDDDWPLVVKASAALRWRFRTPPDPHSS